MAKPQDLKSESCATRSGLPALRFPPSSPVSRWVLPHADFNRQSIQPELLIHISDLQPIGLVEAALEPFDSRQPQLRRPRLQARGQVQVDYLRILRSLHNMHEVPQQGIADAQRFLKGLPVLG